MLFFNVHPEKIFAKAQIEIVSFQTSDADKDFTETIFEGPLHQQLKGALLYLKSQVIKEKIEKVSYQAEAMRYFNFPYEALEETLAHAVYHRNYEISEPIEIRIYPDKIQVLSFPGPDAYINIEDLRNGRVVSRRYRNRQIGNILKELKLTEGKCTGIPTILKAMRNNGSPAPLFETDIDRQALLVTIPAHPGFIPSMFGDVMPAFQVTIPARPEFIPSLPVAKETATTMHMQILEACLTPKSRAEIFQMLHMSNQSKNFNKHIAPMIRSGLIQLTIAKKPNSRMQKYVITPLGKEALAEKK